MSVCVRRGLCVLVSGEAFTFSTRETAKDAPNDHVHSGRSGVTVRVRHCERARVVATHRSAQFGTLAHILRRATVASTNLKYD